MPALARIDHFVLADSIRTAAAAVLSYLAARLLGMPEAYWAAVSTIIVMQ
jgi:uncharacterized membrane protein YccC